MFINQMASIVRSKLFVKLVLEFLPLGLFLFTTAVYGIITGAAVLFVATLISMIVIWVIYRRLALMAIITGVTGLIATALTFMSADPMYVKLKPTIVSAIFGLILATGLVMDKPLLRPLIGEDLNLTDRGWRAITFRWMAYFFFIAILNEIVWRGANAYWPAPNGHGSATADTVWAYFKVVFLMPFTVIFAAFMLPLLDRYRDDKSKPMGGGDIFGAKPADTDKTPAEKNLGPPPGHAATTARASQV
jgi:intracellular septation protein